MKQIKSIITLLSFLAFFSSHSLAQKSLAPIIMDELIDIVPALRQRLCEASSLFFDIRKSKNKPSVLLCDLNDKEFSLTIDALTNNTYHDSKRTESLILLDACYQYKQEVYNPHPEAKEPKRKNTSYFVGKGNVLDYIFISNHLDKENKDAIARVTGYTVFDAHLEEQKDGSLLTSDHAQVVCELIFKTPKEKSNA